MVHGLGVRSVHTNQPEKNEYSSGTVLAHVFDWNYVVPFHPSADGLNLLRAMMSWWNSGLDLSHAKLGIVRAVGCFFCV